MAKKRLPKTLYVVWNYDGTDAFLDCAEDAGCLAEENEAVEAGLYELIEKVKLVNKTTVE